MNKYKRTYSGIIYSYINVINGKVYVGQTTRPKVRHKQHIQAALNNLDGSIFHKAIRKYGIQSFIYRIEKTIVCSSYKMYRKQIDFYETAFIKLYNSKERGYNMTNGGGNVWNNESKKARVSLENIEEKFQNLEKNYIELKTILWKTILELRQ